MKLPFFGRTFLTQLREGAEPNVDKYGGDETWLEALAGGKAFVHESNQVVDPPPELKISDDGDNSANDAENAKRVYTWLKHLRPDLAMEERLWAYLAHCTFANYMKARWPVKTAGIVRRRYLFEDRSFAALSRNGIARLWWASHLTRDEGRQNPFELTETLFMRQDIQVSLLERSMGKCRNVRMAVLDFLRKNMDWLGSEAFGKRIQHILKELNLLGGVTVLDTLSPVELESFLKRVGERLTQKETGADASSS